MSDRTKVVPKHADLTYAHALAIESTPEYKVPCIYAYFQWSEY